MMRDSDRRYRSWECTTSRSMVSCRYGVIMMVRMILLEDDWLKDLQGDVYRLCSTLYDEAKCCILLVDPFC
jgi:hypothetical protein